MRLAKSDRQSARNTSWGNRHSKTNRIDRRQPGTGPGDGRGLHRRRPHGVRLRPQRASLAELGERSGSPHRFDAVDVADDAQVRRWADATLAALGGVDLLINNAALINRNAPLWKVPADEFSRVIDVNIKGVANVIRHFVPSMVAAARA